MAVKTGVRVDPSDAKHLKGKEQKPGATKTKPHGRSTGQDKRSTSQTGY